MVAAVVVRSAVVVAVVVAGGLGGRSQWCGCWTAQRAKHGPALDGDGDGDGTKRDGGTWAEGWAGVKASRWRVGDEVRTRRGGVASKDGTVGHGTKPLRQSERLGAKTPTRHHHQPHASPAASPRVYVAPSPSQYYCYRVYRPSTHYCTHSTLCFSSLPLHSLCTHTHTVAVKPPAVRTA
jgi:hypothetical protein